MKMKNSKASDLENQCPSKKKRTTKSKTDKKVSNKKIDGSTLFSKLSHELWFKIASYLPFHTLTHLKRVNKTMQQLVIAYVDDCKELELRENHHRKKSCELADTICFPFSVSELFENAFQQPNRWKSLTTLHLQTEMLYIDSDKVGQLVESAPKLEEISLQCFYIENSSFLKFVLNLPPLRRFSFHFCDGQISICSLHQLFEHGQNLTHLKLELENCKNLFQ